VARAVVETVQRSLPARTAANVLADLRTVTTPPGAHGGIWRIVTLAAEHAMEAGRRRLSHRVLATGARRGADLAAEASEVAVESFWSVLADACRIPLPVSWRAAAPTYCSRVIVSSLSSPSFSDVQSFTSP
jgi:hypothetical protein